MSNQEDEYEKQFQADIEKAIELSIESSQLEKYQNDHRKKKISMSEVDNSALNRNLPLQPRPRPGQTRSLSTSVAPDYQIRNNASSSPPIYGQVRKSSTSSLPPPPTSSRKPSSSSEVTDLISFHSPTKPEDSFSELTTPPVLYPNLESLRLNENNSSALTNYTSSTSHSTPLQIDCAKTDGKMPPNFLNNANIFSSGPVRSLDIGFRRDFVPGHAPFPKPVHNYGFSRESMTRHSPFPGNFPALAEKPAVDVLKVVSKQENSNLIDLAPSQLILSKESILDDFDPLAPVKTMVSTPQDVASYSEQDDPATFGDGDTEGSIYDTYDPFDYMVSPNSIDGSQGEPIYGIIEEKVTLRPKSSDSVRYPSLEGMNNRFANDCKEWDGKRSLVFDPSKVLRPHPMKTPQITSLRSSVEHIEPWRTNSQLESFCKMVTELRSEFVAGDLSTNVGLVLSPTVDCSYTEPISVKVVVTSPFSSQVVSFTSDLLASVGHVISQVVIDLEAVLPSASPSDYILKVSGLTEYLSSDSSLGDYEYLYQCTKLDEDVALTLVPISELKRPLSRTVQDDTDDIPILPESLIPEEPVQPISYDTLVILLDTMEREMDRVLSAARDLTSQDSSVMPKLQSSGVKQAVKAICSVMGKIETLEISEALDEFENGCSRFIHRSDVSVLADNGPYSTVAVKCRLEQLMLNHANGIRSAVTALIDGYCKAFYVDFRLKSSLDPTPKESRSILENQDPFLLQLGSLHRLDPNWKFSTYLIETQVYNGTRPLKHPTRSESCAPTMGIFQRSPFEQWICLNDIPVCSLPRESRLVFTLYGEVPLPQDHELSKENPGVQQFNRVELGWTAIQCFDHEGVMQQGRFFLSVWPVAPNKRVGPAPDPGTHPIVEHPVLGIFLTDFGIPYHFPDLPDDKYTAVKHDFSSLDHNTQENLLDISAQDTFTKIHVTDREILWEKRHYLHDIPAALPKVLLAASSWDYSSLQSLHSMVYSWKRMEPLAALSLLLPCFPDSAVRSVAVSCLCDLKNDELVDYLPQLVQTLKHETYECNPLAKFLLERSLKSPRIAHSLFWLLAQILPSDLPQNSLDANSGGQEYITSHLHHRRLRILLKALLRISGKALRERFTSQQMLVKNIYGAAQHVKGCKESMRLKILQAELEAIHDTLRESSSGLPLSASVTVEGIKVGTCSYFSSKTLPLKINFISDEGRIFSAIFKVGDPLQQDMLTLQMIRIMDKLWLKEGLDLKMVTFVCVPTGHHSGMIELVENAETLRKIQTEHGLTGSFKDRPIAEWLAKHNPGALEYERAVRNFTASCAGYSVATYVLGICDRHNDNIMLKTTGHLFHIDFGKFLGDAQMFGNFKRDRSPFVLTSDMAYVINGGDRPSQRFQFFVDLCCRAFAVVRKNSGIIRNLLGFMVHAGIPGVTLDSLHYVNKALLPEMSNPEASATFARMIDTALKSWFTQFNFFLHNIAQLRAGSDRDSGELLSFIPKRYTCEEEGRIVGVEIHNFQKRYDTEKYYVYIIRVDRENQPDSSYVARTYNEFCELHQKICTMFPLAKVYSLSAGIHIGRSNIKQVAERRKVDIEKFLVSLFRMAHEVAHSDIVYTFFHPLLRDQEEADIHANKLKEAKKPKPSPSHLVTGQLKLSLQYQRGTLLVMIHHARGLSKVNGGEPNTYVKVYLKPDPDKSTKRKTKVVKRNCHPTFMEMLEYRMTLDVIKSRILQVTIWSYDSLAENDYLGGLEYHLGELEPNVEIAEWFPLSCITR